MSSWFPPNRRSLVEEDGWESSCQDLDIDVPRMDEIMRGVGEALSMKPDIGTQISADLWGIPTRPWPDAPGLVVYYAFTDKEVYLKRVGPADEEEAEVQDEVESDDQGA